MIPFSTIRVGCVLYALLWTSLLLSPIALPAQAPEPETATPDTATAETTAEKGDEEESESKLVPDLTYEQHPGLAYAASKIYFTDQKYSISGFGEFNAVPIAEGKDPSGGDPELYYTGLYRFSTFFGYRIKKNLIFNFEFLGEMLHDGTEEVANDIVIEAMLDWMIDKRFNLRFGYYPLPIAYVNNNDEPIMFFSVNRPEVERLIVPSSWISLGVMGFGRLPGKVSYSAGLVGGLHASDFRAASWVRQGRHIAHGIPESPAFVGKLEKSPLRNLTVGISGYRGGNQDGSEIEGRRVGGILSLGALHGKYETDNWRVVGVSSVGSLTGTEDIFALTGEALGSRTYGHYLETGYNLLPLFGMHGSRKKAPVFVRYERLNTHASVASSLLNAERAENDLRIVTVGVNFNPKRSLVFKGNYQFRKNFSRPLEGDRVEVGMGFIF